MRDFIVFLVFASVVFFGIGEWRGWFLGITGQTPVFVYKSDFVATASRETINRDAIPIEVSGRVRNGTVTVRVIYTDDGSFQTGRSGSPPRELFEETYRSGETIALDRRFENGEGIYTVELVFDGATGLFRVPLPGQAEL